jgi:glycosyltransferase involved in cell wall biosynthesis
LKILHADTDDLENPLRGGQPVRTYQINSRLTHEHEITVLTATYPNCVRHKVRAGIQYHRLGIKVPGLGLSPHLSYLACLPNAVRRIPHDLLIEEFTPPIGFCMLPWWTHKPVISMVQWFFFRDWERRYRLPFEKMMRSLARRGAYRNFIVQTDHMGNYFRDLLPQSSIWTVPCGIAGDVFHAGTSEGDYALFLGRLDINHKGLDYLIEAWKKLVCAGVRIPLKIVGAGPADVWLREQIICHQLGDLIELVGRVEGSAKETWLRGCRFLVMPSRQETFGLTALEAMAVSRPVLAFDIDHLNEVVRPTWGELAKLGDVEDLVRRAAYLWQEPAHAKALGKCGYAQAHAYSWDAIARRQLEIYKEVFCKEQHL